MIDGGEFSEDVPGEQVVEDRFPSGGGDAVDTDPPRGNEEDVFRLILLAQDLGAVLVGDNPAGRGDRAKPVLTEILEQRDDAKSPWILRHPAARTLSRPGIDTSPVKSDRSSIDCRCL